MTGDDVAFARGEFKVLLGACEGRRGVREAVQAVRWVGVVPVVEEVVVQQRAANERGAVDADSGAAEEVRHGDARAGDREHMGVHAHVSMLDEAAREAKAPL